MEISSLQNINIIPILNEGYFMCKKGEEAKEEETPKPKSKQSTYKGKSKKKTYNDDDEDIDDKVNEKIDYESKNVKNHWNYSRWICCFYNHNIFNIKMW